jgi:signal transduction histidine kinase
MNLKIRFLLLIIGTFFIPNILIMLMVYLSFGSVENMKVTHEHFREYHLLSDYLSNAVDKDDFKEFIEDLPAYMNPRLMYPGQTPPPEIFEKFITDNLQPDLRRSILEALPVIFKDGASGVLIVNLPFVDKYSTFRNTPLPYIFPLALISVMTILSLLIIRSINSSLKRIEEATRRVAEGDFEFELTARGNDSIASLTRSFNIMRLKVKEEYDRRARFFMGVSHDLKTPLSSISGYADAILEGYADDEETLDKYVEIIKDKSNILQERVSHLIHYVKLETGEWKAAFESVNLKQFLNTMSKSFLIESGIFKFNFISEITIRDNISVNMDYSLVTRSLENLIHNAFRFSYPESSILFSVSEENDYCVISITNKGEGITKEELSKIFEPFYRVNKSRNDEGFGLGLSNVAAVIKSHGWEIYVDSELKKETIFTIKIPTL